MKALKDSSIKFSFPTLWLFWCGEEERNLRGWVWESPNLDHAHGKRDSAERGEQYEWTPPQRIFAWIPESDFQSRISNRELYPAAPSVKLSARRRRLRCNSRYEGLRALCCSNAGHELCGRRYFHRNVDPQIGDDLRSPSPFPNPQKLCQLLGVSSVRIYLNEDASQRHLFVLMVGFCIRTNSMLRRHFDLLRYPNPFAALCWI